MTISTKTLLANGDVTWLKWFEREVALNADGDEVPADVIKMSTANDCVKIQRWMLLARNRKVRATTTMSDVDMLEHFMAVNLATVVPSTESPNNGQTNRKASRAG